jgi:hypothetical protein
MVKRCIAAAAAMVGTLGGCHSITTATRYSLARTKPAAGGLRQYGLQLDANALVQVDTPNDVVKAVEYCQQLRDKARDDALWDERLGIASGFVGLGLVGVGTALASRDGLSETDTALWAGSAALGAAMTALSVYLLTSAGSERSGSGILTAGLVQMGKVDPYFVTPYVASTVDQARTTTTSVKSSEPGEDTRVTTKTTTAAVAPNAVGKSAADGDGSKQVDTTPSRTIGTKPGPGPHTTDGTLGSGFLYTQPPQLDEHDGASKEVKLVTTEHTLTVAPTDPEIVQRVQWQTCARVLMQWQGGSLGPGAADATAAGAVK